MFEYFHLRNILNNTNIQDMSKSRFFRAVTERSVLMYRKKNGYISWWTFFSACCARRIW